MAGWTAIGVGAHLILVPGVILHLLIPLVRDVGLRNVLATGFGLGFVAILGFSTLAAVATLAAGRDYLRSRGRRGNLLVLIAVALEAVAGSVLLVLRLLA